MWGWAIRLGKWAMTAWGLTEIGTAVTDNVDEMAGDIQVSADKARKGVLNIGVTIAIVFGIIALVTWFVSRKKKR
jgi:hypothetical protein